MGLIQRLKRYSLLKIALFVIGLLTLGFGARLLLLSNIGTGGIDALAVGLSSLFGLSIGIMMNGISLTLIIIGGILKKAGLEWKPIIASLFYGIIFDFWGMVLFNGLQSPTTDLGKGLMFVGGILIATLGAGLYILMGITTSSVDYVMLAICSRYKVSIQVGRILLETLFVIGAYLVSGPIGIGTIAVMLLFGPILELQMKWLELVLIQLKILKKEEKIVGIKVKKYGFKKN